MIPRWLPLLILAPLVVGFAAWIWRRPTGRRASDTSTDNADYSNVALHNWGLPLGHSDSNRACNAAGESSDGGGDSGGDGGGGD